MEGTIMKSKKFDKEEVKYISTLGWLSTLSVAIAAVAAGIMS
jgi:hypothetical protein